jgi:uncharacterized protein
LVLRSEDVIGFLRFLHRKVYPGAVFENVSIHIETPNQALDEYHLTAKSEISGNTVHQQFLGHLMVENGKIKLLRELIDVVAAAEAMFPGGLGDVLRGESA